ncbi:MAG: TlpA family protein disulfide reductase [Planctomycetaceae bacterium]|nr:TlpA family protein disulfide reductase [Planctomycetaceae bacterium]MCA9046114.1 TlpA family protein disulfide reductase [Planctomycetaceae bacterium]
MNESTYNAISIALAICAVIAVVVVIFSFVAMLVRWKTPNRGRHVIRLIIGVTAIPCLIGIQYAILFLGYLPSIGDQQKADFNAERANTLAATSVVGVGDPAPPFSLTTADGAYFALSDTSGDVVLINFFATWCGPCQVELPHVEQIWAARKDDENFKLLVIGREETTESVQEYRKSKGFSFPIAADPDRAVYFHPRSQAPLGNALGTSTPHSDRTATVATVLNIMSP